MTAKTREPRKIGILTFHRCINYGSYWQARSLVEGLRARGYDAVLLDHHCDAATRAEWRCALQPRLPERSPRPEMRLYASKARKFLRAFRSLPRSPCFQLDAPETLEPLDVAVVGSDEVWNLQHPWYGQRRTFYGAGLPAGSLVSYAASFGNHDASHGLGEEWAAQLRGFSAISVRDENSRALVRASLQHEPPVVLDPCLQFPVLRPNRGERFKPRYVAVYGHSFPGWYGEAVRGWARANGLRLVSIGYRNDWADRQRIAAGPEEFARLIGGAAAVATNFFHGCIFALANSKPFAAVASPYRRNKLRDLTGIIGAGRHLLEEGTDRRELDHLLGEPLDATIGQRIAKLRRRSDEYLAHALG